MGTMMARSNSTIKRYEAPSRAFRAEGGSITATKFSIDSTSILARLRANSSCRDLRSFVAASAERVPCASLSVREARACSVSLRSSIRSFRNASCTNSFPLAAIAASSSLTARTEPPMRTYSVSAGLSLPNSFSLRLISLSKMVFASML